MALRPLEGVVGLSVGRAFGLADDMIAGMASIDGRLQGTSFLPEPVSTVVQAIRASFDPHSAAEIAPHITLVYENEITSAAHLRERLAEISGAITPFRLRLSEPRTWGSGTEEGIYPERAGSFPTTDGGPFHLEGVPLVNYLTAPWYLFDPADTVDKVDHTSLLKVSRAAYDIVRATAKVSAAQMRA